MKLILGLDTVPLETLARAQASLSLAHREQPEAGPSRNADAVAAVRAQLAETRKRKGRSERTDEEAERMRRDSKHAPTAMSSKKQVTRFRTVVTIPKAERRDPRFSTVSAGHVDPNLHSKAYDFLPGMLRSELEQLKSAVKVAIKAERNCPRAERPARVSERERLENELARMRTRVERTEREARERDVLSAAKKAEAQKRKDGKGEWYMKKSEKRDLLLKSKFNALEERGGKSAVKKAVEKKRKKIASKEKKSRPFAKGAKDDA
ncbi:hypothetical protein BCR39DRAFT_514618 [Naematelia encephala]|uniref:rRNA biogenesis protein RRP36 n=1 Tax=Naematelia encephala TaxID=71784 RepID=A0A1Y2BJJ4_9TREE|nr:hypothetical protein BCR39DRAFT_514618 [Naematelia encephala]